MTMIDPEQERQRLEAFYAGQMDGELEQVAGQANELTDLARQTLRAELAKRGLAPAFVEEAPVAPKPGPQPGDPPPLSEVQEETESGVIEFRDMVVVRRFRDLPEALLAKGSLDSTGIDCALADDNTVRIDWLWSNAVGGVKLLVGRDDVDEAEQVLSQPIPENFDVTGVGDYEQPRCPKCESLDITFQELYPAAYVSIWLVPIPLQHKAWHCRACNADWEDDAVHGPAESPA